MGWPAIIGSMLAGGLSSAFASNQARPDMLDVNKLRGYQENTQGLVDENLGIGRGLMDPNSALNKQLKALLFKQGQSNAATSSNQIGKLGAMSGMSPGQMMMQNRMSTNTTLGGLNDQWMKHFQNRFGQGLGIMGNMTGVQQGLDENLGNAYVQNVNATNQFRADRQSSTSSGLLGGLQFGIDQWGG